uniref:Putative ovule protein n=1 Tax=Solanum chacoense TaxID=4108 RepID=A0A0V0GNQ2_SOLCH
MYSHLSPLSSSFFQPALSGSLSSLTSGSISYIILPQKTSLQTQLYCQIPLFFTPLPHRNDNIVKRIN